VRDGVPLPGRSPTEVLSQLAYRVFGPLRPDRARVALDHHGLAGHPAERLAEIAARHGVTSGTVSNRVAAVRGAGTRIPVTGEVITEVTRASIPGGDHRARVRAAGTFGLPAPVAPPRLGRVRFASPVSAAQLQAARAAARVLAAVGPLPLDTLLAAVTRSRRFRTRAPLTANGLAAALAAVGATTAPDGSWHPPPGTFVPARYRAIVDTAGGRDLTRQDMILVLIAAGYSRTSAGGRMSSSHPLFTRTGPDRYRIIGSTIPA
jgi:hypothetical protein